MRLLFLTRDLSGRGGPPSIGSLEMARRLGRRCDDFAVLGIGRCASELGRAGEFEVIAGRTTSTGLAGVADAGLAALREPFSWLSAASNLHTRWYFRRAGLADAITVSTTYLAQRFGGICIPHARRCHGARRGERLHPRR